MATILHLTREQARQFQLFANGLIDPIPDVASALRHHGYIQLDPINVCGRMHDLILRNRIAGYREGDLLRFTHDAADPGGRRAFEHYLPGQGILAVFPLEAWSHLAPQMRRRAQRRGGYAGRLSRSEEQIAARILQELADRGPLTSDDIEHDGRAHSGWGSRARAVKVVLEKLFVHGRVLLADRRQFRRVYDLPGRVLPAAMLTAPEPAATDNQRWLVQLRLRQRRLTTLKRSEQARAGDLVREVAVPDCPRLFMLREDEGLLERSIAATRPEYETRLLAPLDPLIYDRKLTARLWNYDYTWEVYTPAARRRRGYYALPVLRRLELVGSVDPCADRAAGRLRVVKRRLKRGHKVADAVQQLAAFLGLRS